MSDETKLMKLAVRLTDGEVHERAQEAAELMLQLDTDKEEETERRKSWKGVYETRERKLRDLSRAVWTRAELRPVEVEEVPVAGRGLIDIVRCDTGEVVYSRPMTDAEKRMAAQGSLWVEPSEPIRTSVGKEQA